MKIDDFVHKQPMLVPEDYFLGRTQGSGMFHDRFGNLRRQFVIDMLGERQGNTLILSENFSYDDGERDRRTWRVNPLGVGHYTGTADDVVGQATGYAAGSTFHWRYQMNMKVDNGHWLIGIDDWMFMQPNGVVLSRSKVTRWRIEIGTLVVCFHKTGGYPAPSGAQTKAPAQMAE